MTRESASAAVADCPKSMVYGPCGGVGFDGVCEVGDRRCVFLDDRLVRWGAPTPSPPERTPAARRGTALLERGEVVIADFPARALDGDSLAECADILALTADAVLAGDAGTARVQFSPALRAAMIRARGVEVWTGLNCRDRNRVALEGELASLVEAGGLGVHCVTGDHTDVGGRPDATPVFDLDSTRLAALARGYGHLVSVAEAPLSPPVRVRPQRLVEKERAGAEVCFVNHAGGVDAVADFVGQARGAGSQALFVACVPVVLDRPSAELLASFTSLVLPEGLLARVLDAADPREEGIRAAVEASEAMWEIPGVVGVDLSGGPLPGGEKPYAQAVAEIGRRVKRSGG